MQCAIEPCENILAVTVVTASGEIIEVGSRAGKSSAGQDLIRAFIGGEGILEIDAAHEVLRGSYFRSAIFGHDSDGSFLALFLIDPEKPANMVEVERLNGLVVQHALEVSGTFTGEHGVGVHNTQLMNAEHGPGAIK